MGTNDMDASVLTATFNSINSIVEKVTTETSTVNEVVSACMCPANRTAGSLNISLMESLQSFTSGPVIEKSLSFIADPDTMASVCLVKGNDSFPSSLQSPTSVAHREAVVDDSRNQSDDAINFVATNIKTDNSATADEAQELNARITATTSTDRTTRASDSIPNPDGDDVSRIIEKKSADQRTPDDIPFDENPLEEEATAPSDESAISSADAPKNNHTVDENAVAAKGDKPVILTQNTGGAALPEKIQQTRHPDPRYQRRSASL